MAKISSEKTTLPWGEEFQRVINYSSKSKQFTINLPRCMRDVFSQLTGDSEIEVITQYIDAVHKYAERATTVEKVILVIADYRGFIFEGLNHNDDEIYRIRRPGDRTMGNYSSDGLNLSLIMGIFEKTTIKIGDDKTIEYNRFDDSTLPDRFNTMHNSPGRWGLDENTIEIEWSADLEEKMVSFVLQLSNFIDRFADLFDDAESLTKVLELSGVPLLTSEATK